MGGGGGGGVGVPHVCCQPNTKKQRLLHQQPSSARISATETLLHETLSGAGGSAQLRRLRHLVISANAEPWPWDGLFTATVHLAQRGIFARSPTPVLVSCDINIGYEVLCRLWLPLEDPGMSCGVLARYVSYLPLGHKNVLTCRKSLMGTFLLSLILCKFQ